MVYDSVKFTFGGDYVHSAPWSVGEQGYVNVSHGYVNVAPGNAASYYDRSVVGSATATAAALLPLRRGSAASASARAGARQPAWRAERRMAIAGGRASAWPEARRRSGLPAGRAQNVPVQ